MFSFVYTEDAVQIDKNASDTFGSVDFIDTPRQLIDALVTTILYT